MRTGYVVRSDSDRFVSGFENVGAQRLCRRRSVSTLTRFAARRVCAASHRVGNDAAPLGRDELQTSHDAARLRMARVSPPVGLGVVRAAERVSCARGLRLTVCS